jgi:hypothetical protein
MYERERHETQFKYEKEKKRYEEVVTVVATCDAWDCTAGDIRCGDSRCKGSADACNDGNREKNQYGNVHESIVFPECVCSEHEEAFGATG